MTTYPMGGVNSQTGDNKLKWMSNNLTNLDNGIFHGIDTGDTGKSAPILGFGGLFTIEWE